MVRIGFFMIWGIAHFTVTGENETGVDLDWIQTFLLYYVNQVFRMLTANFSE